MSLATSAAVQRPVAPKRKPLRVMYVESQRKIYRVEFERLVQPWQAAKVWDYLVIAKRWERLDQVCQQAAVWLQMAVKLELV